MCLQKIIIAIVKNNISIFHKFFLLFIRLSQASGMLTQFIAQCRDMAQSSTLVKKISMKMFANFLLLNNYKLAKKYLMMIEYFFKMSELCNGNDMSYLARSFKIIMCV